MRSYIAWTLLFLMSSFSAGSPTLAGGRGGGMDSGGSDNKDILAGTAWFLGDRTVRYCIDLAPSFGVNKTQARGDIERAFATWNKYISTKRVFENINKHDLGPNRQQYPLQYTSPNYQYFADCDKSIDLIFHLGTTNPEIAAEKKFYENPTAFVYRESFDVNQGWGKGWVWVSPPGAVFPDQRFPDWTRPERLHGVLLHEIGHILGNAHASGTIMDEDLASRLQLAPSADTRAKAILTHIDDSKELFVCTTCAFNFDGELGPGLYPEGSEAMFQRLIGRHSKGKIQARFGYDEKSRHLIVADELGKSDFAIELTDLGIEFQLADNLFHMSRKEPTVIVNGPSATQNGQSSFGQTTIQGITETVIIDRNASTASPMVLSVLVAGKRVPIFTASLPGMSQDD